MNNIQELRDTIINWWQDDPRAKQKLALTSVVVVFALSLFITVIFSFLGSTTSNQNQTNASPQNLSSSRVTLQDSSDLERVSSIESSGLGLLAINGQESVYLDSDLKLVINDEQVRGSPAFIATSLYAQNTRVIINQIDGTTIYSKADNSFTKLPSPITNLTPLENNRFVFMYPNNRSFVVRGLNNINSPDQAQTLDTIRPNLNVSSYRIVVFDNKAYFLFWQNPNQTGNMEIWRMEDNNRLTLLENLANTNQTKITQNGLIIATQTTGTRLDFRFIDYSKEIDGQTADLSRIVQNDSSLTDFNPSQCSSYTENNLLCLIPEPETSGLSKLITLNYQNGNLSEPLPGAVFSGSSLNAINNEIYLLSRNNLIFKVKNLNLR